MWTTIECYFHCYRIRNAPKYILCWGLDFPLRSELLWRYPPATHLVNDCTSIEVMAALNRSIQQTLRMGNLWTGPSAILVELFAILRITGSVPCLLMLLVSSSRQQLWCWLWWMNRSLSFMGIDFNYLCHLSDEKKLNTFFRFLKWI